MRNIRALSVPCLYVKTLQRGCHTIRNFLSRLFYLADSVWNVCLAKLRADSCSVTIVLGDRVTKLTAGRRRLDLCIGIFFVFNLLCECGNCFIIADV